ncbi:MAG: hypothetical protein WCA10_14190 [Terracidiphilus sp.]
MRALRHAPDDRPEPRLVLGCLRVKHYAPDVLLAVEHVVIVVRPLPLGQDNEARLKVSIS